MSFWKFLRRKRQGGTAAFDKSPESLQEAQEHSQEVRRNEAELRRLRHQVKVEEQLLQIADLKAQLSNYNDDNEESSSPGGLNPENMLMTIIANALTSPKAPGASATFSQNPPILTDERSVVPGAEITDEQIKEIIKKLPKNQVKIARSMPDNIIRDYLKKNFPYDESTINRAIVILKEKL